MDATQVSQNRLAGLSIQRATPAAPTSAPQAGKKTYTCRATQLEPRMDLLRPGETVFFDAEHAQYRKDGRYYHRLARPAVLNSAGQTILDVYCYYQNENDITKLVPPKEYNVSWDDLKSKNGAKPAEIVEPQLKTVFTGRKVVVHGGKNDLTAFYILNDAFAASEVIDTQDEYAGLRYERDDHPGLKACAERVLGISSFDAHNPVADAEITRLLYLKKHPEEEMQKVIVQEMGGTGQRGRRGGGRARGRGRGSGGGPVQRIRNDSSSTVNSASSIGSANTTSTAGTGQSTLFTLASEDFPALGK